jgi:hypothetical protein
MYKVAQPNNRWRYGFITLSSAIRFASIIEKRTGSIVAIETYKRRPREPFVIKVNR